MDIIKYFWDNFWFFFLSLETKITIEYPCVYYFVVANQIYCSRFPHYIDFPENIAMRALRFGHYLYDKTPSFMLFCRLQTKITIVYKHIFFFVFKPNLQQYIPSVYWFSIEYDHESIVILTLLSKNTIFYQNYNRISVFSFVLVTPNLQCYIYSFFSTEYGHQRSVILTLFLSKIQFFFQFVVLKPQLLLCIRFFFFICRFQAKFTIVYPLTLSFFNNMAMRSVILTLILSKR